MNKTKNVFHAIVHACFIIVVIVFISTLLRTYVVSPFKVDGHSMENTLVNGERMFLFKVSSIERFDIVVFPEPHDERKFYIKRLIGLPGERLYVKDDQLYINDVPIPEPYLDSLKARLPSPFTKNFSLHDTLGIEVIPEGYVFVMGDNRPHSSDSRQFGLISLNSIIGEASVVYAPWSSIRVVEDYQFDDATESMIESNK